MTTAFKNSLATFVQMQGEFQRLLQVHHNFAKIGDNLTNPPDFLAALFLVRSHSACLAAARLAMSGQLPEAFPLLRSCLEYALYALQINKTSGLNIVWIKRHDDTNCMKETKKAFQHVAVMNTLKSCDARLHGIRRLSTPRA